MNGRHFPFPVTSVLDRAKYAEAPMIRDNGISPKNIGGDLEGLSAGVGERGHSKSYVLRIKVVSRRRDR